MLATIIINLQAPEIRAAALAMGATWVLPADTGIDSSFYEISTWEL